METENNKIYDVAIIGGGASGTALLYTLSKYTDIKNCVLIEKYSRLGQVNSKSSNNSQTLHVGDIETNYSLEKVKQVLTASMMVAKYANSLEDSEKSKILFSTSKMVVGVGQKEVGILEKRYKDLHALFPNLQKLDREGIAKVEPAVVLGRKSEVLLTALFSKEGYAVDFENLAQSFVDSAKKIKTAVEVLYDSNVSSITKGSDGLYSINIKNSEKVIARVVVVDADSYSLFFAKQLGYGKNFSLIPIAGSFYFSKNVLNGKVYTVQEPLLPFAAVHGDPDIRVPNVTRWGPTARFNPVLETGGNFATTRDYAKSSGLGKIKTWVSFFKILLEPIRLFYLIENMLYELPWVGKRMLVKNVQKIAPSIRAKDLRKAKGFGGMRLQRVNTDSKTLELGEGKIVGDKIIFNMTPSPGASVCLYNAFRDTELVVSFLNDGSIFDKERMSSDLG